MNFELSEEQKLMLEEVKRVCKEVIEPQSEKVEKEGKIPEDKCYVNNFKNEDSPRVLTFQAGDGLVRCALCSS